jgi:hypothetical protein
MVILRLVEWIRMMKFRADQVLLFTGWFATVVGCFLPWECAGDIGWICDAGIGLGIQQSLPNFSGEIILMIVALIVVMFLLFWEVKFSHLWYYDIAGWLAVGLLLIACVQYRILTDRDSTLIVYLASFSFWIAGHNFVSNDRYLKLTGIVVSFVALLLAVYNCFQIWNLQISTANISGGTELQSGILLTFVGTNIILLTVSIGYLKNLSANNAN